MSHATSGPRLNYSRVRPTHMRLSSLAVVVDLGMIYCAQPCNLVLTCGLTYAGMLDHCMPCLQINPTNQKMGHAYSASRSSHIHWQHAVLPLTTPNSCPSSRDTRPPAATDNACSLALPPSTSSLFSTTTYLYNLHATPRPALADLTHPGHRPTAPLPENPATQLPDDGQQLHDQGRSQQPLTVTVDMLISETLPRKLPLPAAHAPQHGVHRRSQYPTAFPRPWPIRHLLLLLLLCLLAPSSARKPRPPSSGSSTTGTCAFDESPSQGTCSTAADPSADYIIVGGGTAGSVLAARLCTALPNRTFTLLERGAPRSVDSELRVRAMRHTFTAWQDPALADMLKSQPNPGLSGREVTVVSARTLGGSSAIARGQWTKPPLQTFDGAAWAFDGAAQAPTGACMSALKPQSPPAASVAVPGSMHETSPRSPDPPDTVATHLSPFNTALQSSPHACCAAEQPFASFRVGVSVCTLCSRSPTMHVPHARHVHSRGPGLPCVTAHLIHPPSYPLHTRPTRHLLPNCCWESTFVR